jgi:membrane-associated phospholipid phosphatase
MQVSSPADYGIETSPQSLRTRGSLTPADKTVVAYIAVIALLIIARAGHVEAWPWFLGAHVVGILVIIALAKSSRAARVRVSRSSASLIDRALLFIHAWHPVATIPTTYMELSYLIPRIHPRDFDVELALLDYRIFGAHPTVWLERFTFPALTELLQLVYPMYYFLPIVLGVVLWRSGEFERYFFWVFVIAFGFYLSYLGYFLVPAIGPRFLPEIVQAQTKPLSGVYFYQLIRSALDRAEGITRDCFPSGHTEMTLLVLYYARRFHRPTFYWLLPIGVGIITSTVYLRYHYVVDVFAGVFLAIAVALVAERVYRGLGGSGHGL